MKSVFLISALHIIVFTLFIGIQNTRAQDINIDISAIDVDFETVLKEICKETGYNYRLECKKISKNQKFFVNAKSIRVSEILKQCLEGSTLNFEINNKEIIIFENGRRLELALKKILSQTIKGTIKDKESKESIKGANVVIISDDLGLGASSNEKGVYRIENVPPGRYSIKVSHIGFDEVIVPEILVGSAKEVVLDVELNESVKAIEQVTITADKERPLNDMAMVSARSFRVEETKRYPVSISDPARMALCYAGVATTDDYMNEIIIRGNSPQYLLWRIEGVEVPSPNHFTEGGMNGGAISILSSNVIGRSDFLSGAFPADYGNAISGVFDISLRKGNNELSEISVQAGTLGLDISAEGPFNKTYSGSYLFNYRYSTLAFLNIINLNFIDENPPNYQDLSFNLELPTKKFGRFSFWGVGGASYDATEGLIDSTDWSINETEYREKWADYMMAIGISNIFFPTNTSYIQSTFAMTKYGTLNLVDTLQDETSYNNVYRKKLFNTAYRFAINYNNKINKWINFRAGANFNYYLFKYYLDIIVNHNEKYIFLDADGDTFLSNVFAQTKIKFSKQFTLSTGLNFLYFGLNRSYSVEPRAALQFDFAKNQSISFGYGLHGRHELPIVYFKRYQSDTTTVPASLIPDLPKAHHFVFSYINRFTENFYLKFEAYYQKLLNYYVASDPDYTFSVANNYLDFSIPLSSAGKGRNYGLELTLEKYFTNDYYFLITASIFKSQYQPLNHIWYSTIYDLGHINNIVAGKEFKTGMAKTNIFGINLRMNWTGGKRDTPIDLMESYENDFTVYDESRRNELQYPDYFRIDLGLSYRINKKKLSHVLSVDIQNVTNRKNIAYKYYDPSLKVLTVQNQAGIVPIFNYRIEF